MVFDNREAGAVDGDARADLNSRCGTRWESDLKGTKIRFAIDRFNAPFALNNTYRGMLNMSKVVTRKVFKNKKCLVRWAAWHPAHWLTSEEVLNRRKSGASLYCKICFFVDSYSNIIGKLRMK